MLKMPRQKKGERKERKDILTDWLRDTGPKTYEEICGLINASDSCTVDRVLQGAINAGGIRYNSNCMYEYTPPRRKFTRYDFEQGDGLPDAYYSVMGGVFS